MMKHLGQKEQVPVKPSACANSFLEKNEGKLQTNPADDPLASTCLQKTDRIIIPQKPAIIPHLEPVKSTR